MKRTKQWSLHHFFYYLLAVALLTTACKKGDTGPQGEKGDKGDTGEKGSTGTKGDAGTANVLYSAWLDVAFAQDATSGVFFGQIAEPKVTDNLLSTGEIKVYINFGTPDNKVITPLPFVEGDVQITPIYAAGTIEIDANVNASTVTSSTTGKKSRQYRYILIPGGASVRKNVNWNNYEEVKTYLGLKD
jgi:hypothetical protein